MRLKFKNIMKKRLIYVINNGKNCHGYSNWCEATGYTNDIREADLVLGLGGADWSASYYGENENYRLSTDSNLDEIEWEEFQEAIKLNKKILGVCRSSQIAPVLAGKFDGSNAGKICQHVSHPSMHPMKNIYGDDVMVTSSHHNLQWPFGLSKDSYKILGWAVNNKNSALSPFHLGGNDEEMKTPVDPELVYYPKINFLAKQPHCEWQYNIPQYSETINLFRKILDDFMNDKLE